MRTLLLFAIAAFTAFAQPSAFTRLDLYPSGASTGLLRFFEVRSNGSNYAGIRGRSAMASDCEFVISNLSFEPCGDGLQTLGDPAKRWSHVYSAAATLSGSGNVLQITGSTSGSALDISGGGGGRATSFFATTRMIAGGDGYYVTPDGVTQNQVIDRLRNASVANLTVSGTCSGCSSGVTSINGLTAASQTLATGTAGTDFNISPSGSTNTFNLPNASATARGVVSTGAQTFAGDKTFSGLTTVQGQLRAESGTSPALSLPNATAFNALNIQNGGGAALTWFATNSLNTTGTVAVGPTSFSLQSVIDNGGNHFPYANYSGNLGSLARRFDVLFGRFANLQSNVGSLAGFSIRDTGSIERAYLGDGGGTGGELRLIDSAGSEFFGAINGVVRANGTNALTTTVTVPCGTLTFTQGLLTSKGTCP